MDKFELGQIVATWSVEHMMKVEPDFRTFVMNSMERFKKCDWGDSSADDKARNDNAVKNGDERIMGAYIHPNYPLWKIWIITEYDRSATTILFPSEY